MPKCKKNQVINPETGRCIKEGGAVWRRVFRKKSPRRRTPKRKSPRRKSRKKGCKSGQVINPNTGRCIKEGGSVWKRVFGKKIPRRTIPKRKTSRRKRPSRKRRKKECKSGQVLNPNTGRCIKEGGTVWKRVFRKKIPEKPIIRPRRKRKVKRIRLKTKTSPFRRELEEKLIVKAICDNLKVTRHVKSYTARTYMLLSCINDGIPLRASVSIWDRWVREVKEYWSGIRLKKELEFSTKLKYLYWYLQREQCDLSGSSNFITELYLRGKCNCLSGINLLFALSKYLGYEKKLTKVFMPKHKTFLIVEGWRENRGSVLLNFETTKLKDDSEMEIIYMDNELVEEIRGWMKNEMYVAIISFLEYARVKNKKFYKLSPETQLKYFRALYPKSRLTKFVGKVFTKRREFLKEMHEKTDIYTIGELSVLLYMTLYFISSRSSKVKRLSEDIAYKIEYKLRRTFEIRYKM